MNTEFAVINSEIDLTYRRVSDLSQGILDYALSYVSLPLHSVGELAANSCTES